MAIGALQGVSQGQGFVDRRELYDSGVHRALQAGIVGRGKVGAESIVLSGGYVDDEDYGSVVIYTGEGGRDQNSGRQIANQSFSRGNQALVTSCLEGTPVRLVRKMNVEGNDVSGPKYRYDGLFHVESYWQETGLDGHQVCRFRLVDERAYQGYLGSNSPTELNHSTSARRVESVVQRVVRDTALGRRVKELHDYTCQVCGGRLHCVGGPYAEAAHIRPVGRPHNGPDDLSNLLCLCPNHHVLLDRGALVIDQNWNVQPLATKLRMVDRHKLDPAQTSYHWSIWRNESD
ncbi:YDG/SRA domain-containing protein [Maritimibacter dapengensis]|uniref:HNH endonuclease n=1 Tax=Maritimibacter dapengensis TaxID=2836868 RepID=A0ABS6SWF4_9RHOB|nr:HNH endonuclease [Maritimibacter dapengensis]